MLIPVLFILFVSGEGSILNIWTKYTLDNVLTFPHFWKNTGLCPTVDPKLRADFLLSDDEKLNFDLIGALPNGAIRTVRVHWLLDLVTISGNVSNEPIFNFDNLDRLIDRFHDKGLFPTFELMGNPSNYFYDFRIQGEHWTNLIKKIIQRYSNKYGAYFVHNWNFELMNEPDLLMYNFLNFTLDHYLAYFRASESAVKSLSGPAGLFRPNTTAHALCWGLLDYCSSNPCDLDTITFHRKGGEVGSQIVDGGLELINSIISKYPKLKGVPFGNDEADVLTGWHKPLEWRADVRYAALIVQVIIGHVDTMMRRRDIPFERLSNDNGFLSFYPNHFTQRTLLARFQMNNTSPPHVQFFKKPAYSVMALLSLLGTYVRDARYYPGRRGFSFLETNFKYEDTFVLVVTDDVVKNETYVNKTTDVNIRIEIGNLTLSAISVVYIMDNVRSNPYQVWRDAGSPDFPDADLRRRMRDVEGFHRHTIRPIKPHQAFLKIFLRDLFIPSVVCIQTCFEGTEPPGPPSHLHYVNVTHNEIILMWKDTYVDSRCLLTYAVEFRNSTDTTFQRINSKPSIFLSFHFDGVNVNGSQVGVVGEYRVIAVDYWKRFSPHSNVLTVF